MVSIEEHEPTTGTDESNFEMVGVGGEGGDGGGHGLEHWHASTSTRRGADGVSSCRLNIPYLVSIPCC